MEKFYSSKKLLKLAGEGDASPISPWIRHSTGPFNLNPSFKVRYVNAKNTLIQT